MRGRKPVPTQLKILRGNPGCRPLPTNEPKPRRVLPRPPKHLNERARRIWRSTAKELYVAGLLTTIDVHHLATYCSTYAEQLEAEENVKKTGMVIKTLNGNFIQNPYLGIVHRCIDILNKMRADFGMTPSARARIKVDPDKEDDSFSDRLKAAINGD